MSEIKSSEAELLVQVLSNAKLIATRIEMLEDRVSDISEEKDDISEKQEQKIEELIESILDNKEYVNESCIEDIINEAKDDLDIDEMVEDSFSGYMTKEEFTNQLVSMKEMIDLKLKTATLVLVNEVEYLTGIVLDAGSVENLSLKIKIQNGVDSLTMVSMLNDKFDNIVAVQQRLSKSIAKLKNVFQHASKVFKDEDSCN